MVKHFTRAFLILLIATELLVAGAVLWLQMGGQRDMNWARGWLVSALNPNGAPFDITIGDVTVDWQDIREFGSLHVTNMRMAQKNGEIFAVLPHVNVTIDPVGFLPRHRVLHGIRLDAPRLFLQRDAEGMVRFGLDGAEQSLPVTDFIAFFASDDAETDQQRGRLPFREFGIDKAQLRFIDASSGTRLTSAPFSFSISRTRQDLSGALSMPFIYGDQRGSITAKLVTQPLTHERQLQADMKALPSELICLFAVCPADASFSGKLTGSIHATRAADDGEIKARATLATENAVAVIPAWFPKALKLKKAGLVVQALKQGDRQDILLEALTIELPDTNIAAKGQATKKADGWYATGEGVCSKLLMSKLYKYWPLPLAADSRNWVINKIKDGYAESGSLKFNIVPQDLVEENSRDKMIDATVLARNLEIDYLRDFPTVKGVDGTVKFTGKTITAKVDRGNLLTGTTLKPSILTFTNLDIPDTPTETTLNLSAPASDVATILKLKPFTFDDPLNLDPAHITGQVDASLKLAFDAFGKGGDEVNLDAVDYDIDATFTNVGQPQLLNGRDIAGLNGTLKANAKEVTFDGNMKLDGGTDVRLSLRDAGGQTTATAKGSLARQQFASFGLPDLKEVGNGKIGVDAEVLIHKDATVLKRATIDLTPIALSIPQISWSKPAGGAASLALTPGNEPLHYGVTLSAPDLEVSDAHLSMTPAMDDVASLSLGRVKTSKNDFSLIYNTTADGYQVSLTGTRLDNSDAFALPADGEDSLLKDFPPITLNLNLGELVLMPDHPLRQLKGNLTCNKLRCESTSINGLAEDAPLHATINRESGARTLTIKTDNAGKFLRALDISDNVYGGKLELKGNYNDAQNPAPFDGRLLIENFKIKDSPILARILSVGSLSGMLNLLTGAGIDFEKLGGNVAATSGVVHLSKGRASSNAIGITVEGTVDIPKNTLNLKGVVVPANMLNSLLNKLPLIGALAGGEGEGLIAFNYSVKGSMADPDVFVNPLSGFTPGILRKIFSGGDADTVPEATPTTEKPAVPPAASEAPVPAVTPTTEKSVIAPETPAAATQP